MHNWYSSCTVYVMTQDPSSVAPREVMFIHICKTGGHTVFDAFAPHEATRRIRWWRPPHNLCSGSSRFGRYNAMARNANHFPALLAREAIGEVRFARVFKFGFARNPWARLVSAYAFRFVASDGRTIDWSSRFSFREFVERLDDPVEEGRHIVHGLNCLDWLCDENGELLVDFVGKLESLKQDIVALAKRLDLPFIHLRHLNQSEHGDYRSYYDDHTAKLVATRFARDIQHFGYTFDSSSN